MHNKLVKKSINSVELSNTKDIQRFSFLIIRTGKIDHNLAWFYTKQSKQGWAGKALLAFPFLSFAVAGNSNEFLLPVGNDILLPAKKSVADELKNCCRKVQKLSS